MLFIDNHESEMFYRRKNSGANADYNPRFSSRDSSPLGPTLARDKAAV
jgi:hypothetical protein